MQKIRIVLIIAAVVGLLTAISVFMAFKAKEELLKQAIATHQTTHLQIAVGLSKGIELFLSQVRQRISILTEYPELLQLDPVVPTASPAPPASDIVKNLEKCYERIADKVSDIAILDHKGIVRYLVPYDPRKIGTNYSHFPYVAQAFDKQTTVVNYPHLALNQKISLATVLPIYSQSATGKQMLKGMIVTNVPFTSIEKDCLKPVVIQAHAMWIISKEKLILSHPINAYIGKILANPDATLHEPQSAIDRTVSLADIVSGQMGSGVYRNSWGKDEVIAYVPIFSRHEERGVFHTSYDATVVVSILQTKIIEAVYDAWLSWVIYIVIILAVSYTSLGILYYTLRAKIKLEQEKKFYDRLMMAEKLSSLSQLALGVAHEINNPLAAIGGYAEALLRRTKKLTCFNTEELQDFPEYLAIINNQIFRCKDICQRLLNFAHQDRAGFQRLDIKNIIEDTMLLLRKTAEESGVALESDFPADLPTIMGEQGRLRQLFFNLISNAIEHKTANAGITPWVKIAAVAQGQYLTISIIDNGQGIAQKLHNKIFEPFFTTKPLGRGTGLGLSIVQHIVAEHNGKVSFHSKEGEGSTFFVVLPLSQGTA